jgi:hypothetical protein
MEDLHEDPAKAAGMELDNNTDVLNNADSAATPCTLGVNTPELTDDHGTNSADEAVLSNNKHFLIGPANLNVQANGTLPEPVPTTQTTSCLAVSLNLYLVYIVNTCQDAMTQIHHCLGAHTTTFHAYYVTHSAGLHC